tara:strand:- start:7009 stop:7374 length:366 start_codon:yes stop_codon:yes gene_type:complete
MISRSLNSNNDIIIQDGRIKIVEDGAEVVQHVRTRLHFYLEEWFLDLTAGTPYYQEIFTKPANLANIESILKAKVLGTDGVDSLTKFTMDYEGGSSRRLTVSFSAETIYGFIDEEEVAINV